MQNQEILNTLANLINNANNNNQLSFDTAFQIFIDYSKAKCRIDTINYYISKYKVLKSTLDELGIFHTGQMSKIVYRRIINVLSIKEYSNASINKFCDLLKSIFKVCNELEYINFNPIAGIQKLKEKKVKIEIVKKSTKKLITDYLFNLPHSALNLRNVCLFLILNDTGARLNEVINIKLKNLELENRSIYLEFTKTGEPRYVYLSDITINYILEYLTHHKKLSDYFFINLKTNQQLDKHTVYDIIKDIKEKLNIDFSISPHKWRHSLATELVNKNVHANKIMSVLGHTQFSTTQRYIHLNDNKIKNDVLKVIQNKKIL